jgi:hypothetical protein
MSPPVETLQLRRGINIRPVNRELAVGLFVVRAWYEDDQFRARVTRSADVGAETATQLATADINELDDYFHAWLAELAGRAPGKVP